VKDMGGLRKFMPITHFSFLIACLAISGIPPFAGFFSKEAILHAAHQKSFVVYAIAMLTSFLTAFYMFRLYFSIFWSKDKEAPEHYHGEGTWSMKLPLFILAIASTTFGFIPFSNYVSSDGKGIASHLDVLFSIAPVTLGLLGFILAMILYKKSSDLPERFAASLGSLFTWIKHKFYIDQLYLFITHKVLFNLIGKPAAWIDKNIIEGFYLLVASLTQSSSTAIKGFQSGSLQSYALYFLGGVLGLSLLLFYALM
jgi:NADH-quinone oxidoreductase subunit L